MSASQPSPLSGSAQNVSQPALLSTAKPDYFTLFGGGISITYLPLGAGGVAHFSYQDPHRSMNFSGEQIRTVNVTDLGVIVSVTLTQTPDFGSTTFSVFIPAVNLTNQKGSSAVIHSEGITTLHKSGLAPQFNLGQTETYTVTPMSGNASNVLILPL